MATDTGSNSQRKLLAVAASIIAVLLLVIVILLVNRNKTVNANQDLTTQLDEAEQLKAELEKEYYEALSELEEMRGSNEELNALIEKQQAELKASKTQIEGLLSNKNELARARREINNLTTKVQEYVAEIEKLRQENEELVAQTEELSSENQTLSTNLNQQRDSTRRLVSAREALLSEKEQLEATRRRLAKKVNIASVVQVESLDVEGQKVRNNGKFASRRSAKNVEQIQICFETTANQVAEPGTEVFLIRIINPNGETLAIDNLGSGTFQNNADLQTVRFTKMAEVSYENDVNDICTIWAPGQAFQEGVYNIEIYNKGYLAGSTQLELR